MWNAKIRLPSMRTAEWDNRIVYTIARSAQSSAVLIKRHWTARVHTRCWSRDDQSWVHICDCGGCDRPSASRRCRRNYTNSILLFACDTPVGECVPASVRRSLPFMDGVLSRNRSFIALIICAFYLHYLSIRSFVIVHARSAARSPAFMDSVLSGNHLFSTLIICAFYLYYLSIRSFAIICVRSAALKPLPATGKGTSVQIKVTNTYLLGGRAKVSEYPILNTHIGIFIESCFQFRMAFRRQHHRRTVLDLFEPFRMFV